jgi:hypothetical protein
MLDCVPRDGRLRDSAAAASRMEASRETASRDCGAESMTVSDRELCAVLHIFFSVVSQPELPYQRRFTNLFFSPAPLVEDYYHRLLKWKEKVSVYLMCNFTVLYQFDADLGFSVEDTDSMLDLQQVEKSVLRIRYVYPGSKFFHPPGSRVKKILALHQRFSVFLTQKIVSKLWEI